MAERNINGVPHLFHEHGALPLVLPPDALSDKEHDFRQGELLYTPYRGVLPTPAFSRERFEALKSLAKRSNSFDSFSNAYAVARALIFRKQAEPVRFDEEMGCWLLPLSAEYDDQKRARYPHLSIPALGTSNTSAHQLTYLHLRGIDIPKYTIGNGSGSERRMPLDHLCHAHACCNPYHLEAVSIGVNSQRGRTVRSAKANQALHQIEPGIVSYQELKQYLKEFEAIIPGSDSTSMSLSMGRAGIVGTRIAATSESIHPTLFTDLEA